MAVPISTETQRGEQLSGEESPEVSVIIVSYNAGDYLVPAVKSVLDQQGVTLELVLIDNGSTDGSVVRCLEQIRDSRLRPVHLPENRYHPGGLNVALPLCRGRWVAMMDADDLSLPGRLATQRDFLRQNPAIALVSCVADWIDEKGLVQGRFFSILEEPDARAYIEFDTPFLLNTSMAERAWWQRRGWREGFRYAPDFDLFSRGEAGDRMHCLPTVLYHYRVHALSSTVGQGNFQVLSACFVRLSAARRGSGREENYDGLVKEHDQMIARNPTVPVIYEDFTRRFEAEGFFALAVFSVRRISGSRVNARAVVWLLRILLKATFGGRDRRTWFLFRLALLGPAAALRVRSTPPQRSRWLRLFQTGLRTQASTESVAPNGRWPRVSR